MATFLKDDQNILVRDLNRFRKIYRYMRKKPRPLSCEGSDISHFTWGAYLVEFNYENEVSHVFPCCYDTPPAIVATTVAASSTGTNSTAKVSFLTFGEDITASGYDPTDTKVGTIGTTKKDDIEREWIDLKNVDGSINRIQFTDGASGSPDNAPHPSYLPSYSPNNTTTVDISDVTHYGLSSGASTFSGGSAASVTFTFQHPPGSPSTYIDSTFSLNSNVYGSNKLSDLLKNLWWDFRNNSLDSNSVWRVVIGGGGDYPSDHAASPRGAVVSRTPDKTFSVTPSGSTLGDWLTSFKSLLSTTTVGGSKFTDRWDVTTTNGTSGSAGATLTFTAKTGNKGALSDLANPTPSNPAWYDSYNKAKDDVDDLDIIATQSANTQGTGTESETTNKGLLSKIIDKVNGDSNINTKWVASASTNSVERIDSTGGTNHYETFVLTFTATEGNKGVISNITDGSNPAPGNFYYHFGDWLSKNSTSVTPGAHFFSLTAPAQYRNERYPDNNGQTPDPVPTLTANGSASGGRPTPDSNPNYNVFVTDVTTSGCKFRTSGNFTGYVYYQALEDGAYTMPNIGKSLEVKTLTFDGTADYITYPFQATFACDPIVTVTADEDVNAFVTALSKTSVTVEVSKAGYQGKVYIQAIEKGC